MKWHCLYPGATVVTKSKSADTWATAAGIEFHEVCIQTNAHDLTLASSDLRVSELPPDYVPFSMPDQVN